MNIFESRAIEFMYCNSYIPSIDDALSGDQYMKNKLFWGTPFDIIMIPIGIFMLRKEVKK